MKIIKVLSIVSLLMLSKANAALILDIQSGVLHGAQNVDVAGTLYDVQFLEGTCENLFNGCDDASDFAFSAFDTDATTGFDTKDSNFTRDIDARSASWALLEQVLIGVYDSDPTNTNFGCGSATRCKIITPYATDGSNYSFANLVNLSSTDVDFVPNKTAGGAKSITTGTTNNNQEVFAVWSVSAVGNPNGNPSTSVPEPSTLAVFALGLLGLVARRKTR